MVKCLVCRNNFYLDTKKYKPDIDIINCSHCNTTFNYIRQYGKIKLIRMGTKT